MKKAAIRFLVFLTVLSTISVLGIYVCRGLPSNPPTVHYPLSEPASNDAQLDINSATKEELMALPGIGETYAQRIIDYRQAHGPFTSITDLLQIEGIGAQRLEHIIDLIKIGGTQ